MIFVEDAASNIIDTLQTEDVDVTSVTIEKVEITSKNDHKPRYRFKFKIQTAIRS